MSDYIQKIRAGLTERVIESGMEKSKIPVYCQHCKRKQIIHVFVRAGRSPMNNQTVTCIACKKDFDVLVADPIIGGPFPE
jgi:transposase-like protein